MISNFSPDDFTGPGIPKGARFNRGELPDRTDLPNQGAGQHENQGTESKNTESKSTERKSTQDPASKGSEQNGVLSRSFFSNGIDLPNNFNPPPPDIGSQALTASPTNNRAQDKVQESSIDETPKRSNSKFSVLAAEYREIMQYPMGEGEDPGPQMPARCRAVWFQAGQILSSLRIGSADSSKLDHSAQEFEIHKNRTAINQLLPIVRNAAHVLASAGVTGCFYKLGTDRSPQGVWQRLGGWLAPFTGRREIGNCSDVVAADGLLQIILPMAAPHPTVFPAIIKTMCTQIREIDRKYKPGLPRNQPLPLQNVAQSRLSTNATLRSLRELESATNTHNVRVSAADFKSGCRAPAPLPSLAMYNLGVAAARAYGINSTLLPAVEEFLTVINLRRCGVADDLLKFGTPSPQVRDTNSANQIDLDRTA